MSAHRTPIRLRGTVRRALASSIVFVACATLATCGKSDAPTATGTTVALGSWGGDNVAIIATDSLTHVHVGCTFGDFPGGIVLRADGSFAVNGSYMLHAFPVAVGPAMPAQLSGTVSGSTLTFAIAVYDTTAKQVVSLGPGVVVFGQDPQMGACPVCQVPGRDRALLIRPMRMSRTNAVAR